MKGKVTSTSKDIFDDRHAKDHQNLGSLNWQYQCSSMMHSIVVPPQLWNVHEAPIAGNDCMNNVWEECVGGQEPRLDLSKLLGTVNHPFVSK